MKIQKKTLITTLLAATMALTNFVGCNNLGVEAEIKNVILVIGDGMGENHMENALTYFDLERPSFFDDRAGSLATRSADSDVTDSAAAATALATGKKVNNGEVSRHNGKDLTSISQLALKAGKRVGVVTTDTLDGATPAAFSSHANNRDDDTDIINGQMTSDIDLLMGERSNLYGSSFNLFEEHGYDTISSPDYLEKYMDSEKLLVTLPNIRSEYAPYCQNDFQLKEMAAFAIEYLDNDNGYFLMIEGAYIDKYSHNNALELALCETRSLFDCVEYLYSVVGDDTAIIVTADHETGSLDKAESKDMMFDSLYHSSSHTSRDVPLFIHNFTLKYEDVRQNNQIFTICKQLLKL